MSLYIVTALWNPTLSLPTLFLYVIYVIYVSCAVQGHVMFSDLKIPESHKGALLVCNLSMIIMSMTKALSRSDFQAKRLVC